VELELLIPPLEPVELEPELLLLGSELDEPLVPVLPLLVPPAPIDPVLEPLDLLADDPEPEAPPAVSEPPLLQADSDRAAAAIRASAVPRVIWEAFIWRLLWLLCLEDEKRAALRCLKFTLGVVRAQTVVCHCRTL